MTSTGVGSEIDISGFFSLAASGKMSITTNSEGQVKFGSNVKKLEQVTISAASLGDLVGFDPLKIEMAYESSVKINGAAIDLPNSVTNISETIITGGLDVAADGVYTSNSNLILSGDAWLQSAEKGVFDIKADLLGDTIASGYFAVNGTIRFSNGSVQNPQKFEVMGQDKDATATGFQNNFAIGRVELTNKTYVLLVDQNDNSTGTGKEALYVKTLVVGANCTLDLNGHNIYVYGSIINGTVVNGSITQLSDTGTILYDSPTPGKIGVAGETDQWTFYAQKGESLVATLAVGSGKSALLESPFLNYGEIKLYDPNGNLIKTVSGTSSGQNVTLQLDSLPLDGNYRIDVSAATTRPENVGNYVLTVTPMMLHDQTLPLNKNVTGTLANQYVTDRWVFSVETGQQIKFELLNRSTTDISFKLTDSTGTVIFDNRTTSSDTISITKSGKYTLAVSKTSDRNSSYAFRVDQTGAASLTLNTPTTGTATGNAYSNVYVVDITDTKPLAILLNDYAAANNLRLYAKYSYAPSTTDYDFISTGSTEQSITIPQTHSGKLYIMVVGEYVPEPSTFTITAEHKNLIVNNVATSQFGSNEPITITITGAGFDKTTTVTLVDSNNTRYNALTVSQENVTTLEVTFDPTIPKDTYKIEIKNDNSNAITLNDAVTIKENYGQSEFDAKLILPSQLGWHVAATLYIEYTNKGTTAISAPILTLRVTDETGYEGAMLSLDQHFVVGSFYTSNRPEGFLTSIQLSAGGATTGILQPGETISVPVYWNGFEIDNWNANSKFEFSLEILSPDNTTPLNFEELKTSLKPSSMDDAAWDVIFTRLQSIMGTTVGDYVKMLNNIATAATGQSLYASDLRNINELFTTALKWANDEFNPFGTLVSSIDAAVVGLNATLYFERSFIGTDIASRFVESDLGYGWDHNWNWKLAIKSDGDVILTGSHGAQRIFQVDGRREGTFLSSPGDNGSLRLYANGEYSLTEADGTELRFTSNGLLKSITDTNGNIVTATQSNGKLTKLADAYGNFITLTYNADGKIISVTDNLNNTTTYSYDASGKNLVSATNQQNQTVAYNYASQTTGVLAHTLSSITFADGNVQTFTYDETGTLIKTEINDITPISYIGGKTSKTMLNYEVYEGDIIVQKLKLNKNGQITKAEDSQGRIVFYEYDYFGRVTKISDGSGKYSTIEYDKNGNITRSVNTNGEELRFTYSAKYNNLVTLIDSNGNKTTFRYDTRGNLVSMERADGTTSGITYNSDGSIALVSNRRGDSYSYTYDTNGQLTETKLSTAEKPIRREYDSRGNLVKITDENDLVTTMEYDSNDWLTKITYPTGKSLEYTYDTFGRQTSIKSGTEYHIKYTYNSLGFLENVIDGLHGDTIITQYLYDNLGQLTKEIQGNGTYSEYIYDELGYTKSLVTYDSNDTVLSQFVYTYDTAGLIETSQTLDGQWTYSYDSTGQLTTADFISTNVSISDQSYVYVYDSAGNRIETVTNGTTIEYVVNEMNQYTKVGDFEYKYDADGNMIQKKNTKTNEIWTFTWSQDDKLISSTSPDGTWEYEYDSFGNRIAVIFNGVRTEFLIDLNGLGNIIAEYDSNGNIITTYSHGYGLTSQIDNSGNTAYYGYDALGSTSIITDAAGSIVNHYVYDPFGQSLLKQEGINNPFQYVGEFGVVTDQHTELVSMRARWYDANTGRFISEDPIGLNGGLNLYAYVENNTINFVNPSGELPIIPVIIGAGLVANLFNPNYANAPTSTSDSVYKWTTSDTVSLAFDAITGAYLATALPATGIMTASAKILANKIKSYPVGGKMVKPVREWMQSTMGIGNFLKTKQITHFLKPIKQWVGDHPYPTYGLLFIGSRLLKGALKELVGAFDPNEMLGPDSYGEEGYVKGDTTLPYRINFENDKTATAPAQRVDIVNQLDDKLDLSTFRLTQFGFGDITVTVPQDASMNRYEHTIEFTTETGKLIHVLFVSELDYETRTLYISFESLDPDTLLPPSIFDGFLPPENETGRGMGFVSYTIKHNANLVTGDSFKNIARIQFDLGEKIYTNQIDPHDPTKGTNPDLEAHITIDKDKPTSSVEAFSYSEAATQFAVNWGGTDVGSGIAGYDIFVSIDDGAFEIWLPKTTDTSGLYFGEIGHTYSFYSVAYDNVGLAETKSPTAEATVTVTYEAGTLQTPQNLRTQQAAKPTFALDWDSIADATQYELQRKTEGGSFVTVYTGINSDFVDSELAANTKYTYRVRAFDASNSSIYGNEFIVTTLGGAASHHEQGFIVDIPMVTKIDVDLDTNKTTLTWSHLGDDYSYYVFRNGSLVSVAQAGTSYVDNNPSETVRYLLYAYHKPTGQWSKSLPIVQSKATIKSEIISHSITPQGGITLNWNIPESQQFVIFRNGIPVSGNVSGQSWTDTIPRNGDNQYTLYVNYYDQQTNRYVWTYSKTYVVSKPVNAQAAALPENFWSVYDLDLIDDVLIATI
jgi:RHS repeat-associated protein